MAIKAGNNLAVGLCCECDVAGESGRKRGRCNLSASLPSRSAQGRTPYVSGLRVKRIELVLRQRSIAQFELYWDIVKPAGRETPIEMA
jgi:hypothetical protein